jgi:hypothetical protein
MARITRYTLPVVLLAGLAVLEPRMVPRAVALLAALLTLAAALPAEAKTQRDPHQRALFVKAHPCPATGKSRGACPGYVVDHVKPLYAGGADRSNNMQWQTVADAKKKDRLEAQECRALRRK